MLARSERTRDRTRADLGIGYVVEVTRRGSPLGVDDWVATPVAFYRLSVPNIDISPTPDVGEWDGSSADDAIEQAIAGTDLWLDRFAASLGGPSRP